MNIRIMFFFIIQIVQYVVNSMSNRFVAYHHLSSFHLQYVFSCFSFPHWREKCQAAKFPTSLSRDFNHDWNVENMQKRWPPTRKPLTTGEGIRWGKFRRFLACLTVDWANGANQTHKHWWNFTLKVVMQCRKKTYVHIYIYTSYMKKTIWCKIIDDLSDSILDLFRVI